MAKTLHGQATRAFLSCLVFGLKQIATVSSGGGLGCEIPGPAD
jgi:hypothetical protein